MSNYLEDPGTRGRMAAASQEGLAHAAAVAAASTLREPFGNTKPRCATQAAIPHSTHTTHTEFSRQQTPCPHAVGPLDPASWVGDTVHHAGDVAQRLMLSGWPLHCWLCHVALFASLCSRVPVQNRNAAASRSRQPLVTACAEICPSEAVSASPSGRCCSAHASRVDARRGGAHLAKSRCGPGTPAALRQRAQGERPPPQHVLGTRPRSRRVQCNAVRAVRRRRGGRRRRGAVGPA